MKARVPILVMMALLALALFASAALSQNDNDDATSPATAGAEDDDDHAAALPRTGGPALIEPLAGALLLGCGVLAGLATLRRNL
jgi:hypothetical protein